MLIRTATIDYLIEQEENLRLRPLIAQDRQDVISLYIDEEILVREALKLGYENLSRIRSLLIQNMRSYLAKNVLEASDQDLRAYFDANPDQFRVRPRYSINHVSLKDPPADLAGMLRQLNNGADPELLGDEVQGFYSGAQCGAVFRAVRPRHSP